MLHACVRHTVTTYYVQHWPITRHMFSGMLLILPPRDKPKVDAEHVEMFDERSQGAWSPHQRNTRRMRLKRTAVTIATMGSSLRLPAGTLDEAIVVDLVLFSEGGEGEKAGRKEREGMGLVTF